MARGGKDVPKVTTEGSDKSDIADKQAVIPPSVTETYDLGILSHAQALVRDFQACGEYLDRCKTLRTVPEHEIQRLHKAIHRAVEEQLDAKAVSRLPALEINSLSDEILLHMFRKATIATTTKLPRSVFNNLSSSVSQLVLKLEKDRTNASSQILSPQPASSQSMLSRKTAKSLLAKVRAPVDGRTIKNHRSRHSLSRDDRSIRSPDADMDGDKGKRTTVYADAENSATEQTLTMRHLSIEEDSVGHSAGHKGSKPATTKATADKTINLITTKDDDEGREHSKPDSDMNNHLDTLLLPEDAKLRGKQRFEGVLIKTYSAHLCVPVPSIPQYDQLVAIPKFGLLQRIKDSFDHVTGFPKRLKTSVIYFADAIWLEAGKLAVLAYSGVSRDLVRLQENQSWAENLFEPKTYQIQVADFPSLESINDARYPEVKRRIFKGLIAENPQLGSCIGLSDALINEQYGLVITLSDPYSANSTIEKGIHWNGKHYHRLKHAMPQCSRCQSFGHSQQVCLRLLICPKYAAQHSAEECTLNKAHCANCKGQHAANISRCPLQKLFNAPNTPTKSFPMPRSVVLMPSSEETQDQPTSETGPVETRVTTPSPMQIHWALTTIPIKQEDDREEEEVFYYDEDSRATQEMQNAEVINDNREEGEISYYDEASHEPQHMQQPDPTAMQECPLSAKSREEADGNHYSPAPPDGSQLSNALILQNLDAMRAAIIHLTSQLEASQQQPEAARKRVRDEPAVSESAFRLSENVPKRARRW